jgi:voltage-gated potassium channel
MKKRLILIAVVALISFAVTGLLFYYLEAGQNPQVMSFFDVFWWWVVTSTTLGYGDIVPVTGAGRIVAIFAIVVGFFIYTNLVAIIAESVHSLLDRHVKGRVPVKASGHIVICEYTAVADELIQSLPDWNAMSDKDVVVVTDLVTRNPYPKHKFVAGVPINPAALQRASVATADVVFVFANLRFADPDVKTMHIATRVMAQNSDARIFVELVDTQNDLLKYAPPRVVPLNSRKLIECVMKDGRISASAWQDMCGG